MVQLLMQGGSDLSMLEIGEWGNSLPPRFRTPEATPEISLATGYTKLYGEPADFNRPNRRATIMTLEQLDLSWGHLRKSSIQSQESEGSKASSSHSLEPETVSQWHNY